MNTAGKRFSAINHGSPWRGVCTIPDGTIAAVDRLSLAYLYAFESSAEAPVGGGWAESASIFIPGADDIATFQPGAIQASVFNPGADMMEST